MNFKNYKNIFLDRDGVINEIIMRDNIVSSPRNIDEFIIREDFIKFYNFIKSEDKNLFVVTNQPDLGRKLLKNKDFLSMHGILEELFNFKQIEHCPHTDELCCKCRKPLPGMILKIIEEFSLDKSSCVMIGDGEKDLLAAKNSEIDFILLKTSYNAHIVDSQVIENLINLIKPNL